MLRLLGALCILLLLALQPLLPRPAAADERTPQAAVDEATELARQAAEKLMQALRSAVDSFPYEAPRVTEDGDIVIRRKPSAEPPAEKLPSPGGREELFRT